MQLYMHIIFSGIPQKHPWGASSREKTPQFFGMIFGRPQILRIEKQGDIHGVYSTWLRSKSMVDSTSLFGGLYHDHENVVKNMLKQ